MFLGYIHRFFDLIFLALFIYLYFKGEGKGDKIKAHEMERNKVVIFMVLRAFHLEIE